MQICPCEANERDRRLNPGELQCTLHCPFSSGLGMLTFSIYTLSAHCTCHLYRAYLYQVGEDGMSTCVAPPCMTKAIAHAQSKLPTSRLPSGTQESWKCAPATADVNEDPACLSAYQANPVACIISIKQACSQCLVQAYDCRLALRADRTAALLWA